MVQQDPHRIVMDPDKLLELGLALERAGATWLRPCVVKQDWMSSPVVLGGERRFAARVRLGSIGLMSVYEIQDWVGFLGWLTLDAEQPGRTNLSVTEAARLTIKIAKYLRTSRQDHVDENVADMNGLDMEELRDARYTLNAYDKLPDEIKPASVSTMKEMEDGLIKPHGAFMRVRRAHRAFDDAAKAPSANEQRAVLNRALATLEGVTGALAELGPISPRLTTEERAGWESKARAARRRLDQLVKALKGENK